VFNEKDMVIMKQMQQQQMGLQKLIQEFRSNNADKLLEENKQLNDRLYRLEIEDRDIKNREIEDMGYYTMQPGIIET
jgi:isopropylmalate/homocitrate/citramalate synthase